MDSHRVFIERLKRLLAAAALLLIALFVLWPMFQRSPRTPSASHTNLSLPNATTPTLKQMLGAAWHGLTNKDEPFVVTAQRTVQQTPIEFKMEGLHAQILGTDQSTNRMEFEATQGHAKKDEKRMFLESGVIMRGSNGYTLTTPTAVVDFSQGIAYGQEDVQGQSPLGTIQAHGFMVKEKGAIVQFNGGVKLRMDGTQAKQVLM